MRELSASYSHACLTCSLSDKELSEYFQYKKRKAGLLPLKYAISHVGEQDDGTWVLGDNAHFTSEGEVILPDDYRYVWLGVLFRGSGIVSQLQQCRIQLPFTADPLAHLLHSLRTSMAHNFYPCILTIAGMTSTHLLG